jgi:hypothetical protein
MLAQPGFSSWPDSEAHRPTRPKLLPPMTPDVGPWNGSSPGPARGTQSTGQAVESAIGGSALQTAAGRRHHGTSAVSSYLRPGRLAVAGPAVWDTAAAKHDDQPRQLQPRNQGLAGGHRGPWGQRDAQPAGPMERRAGWDPRPRSWRFGEGVKLLAQQGWAMSRVALPLRRRPHASPSPRSHHYLWR